MFEYWSIYLNILSIFFCIITISVIVFKMLRERKLNRRSNFKEEIYAHLIRQEMEKSFERILNAVNKERRFLCEYLEQGKTHKAEERLKTSVRPKATTRKSTGKDITPEGRAPAQTKYAKAVQMAGNGIVSKKISEAIDIPKGEVDLIINLNRNQIRP